MSHSQLCAKIFNPVEKARISKRFTICLVIKFLNINLGHFLSCSKTVARSLGGWWKYDIRTNREIETAFSAQQCELDVTLCGQVYVIDLITNVQYCKDWPQRKRDIKRDSHDSNDFVKGVAGIFQIGDADDGRSESPLSDTSNESIINLT